MSELPHYYSSNQAEKNEIKLDVGGHLVVDESDMYVGGVSVPSGMTPSLTCSRPPMGTMLSSNTPTHPNCRSSHTPLIIDIDSEEEEEESYDPKAIAMREKWKRWEEEEEQAKWKEGGQDLQSTGLVNKIKEVLRL